MIIALMHGEISTHTKFDLCILRFLAETLRFFVSHLGVLPYHVIGPVRSDLVFQVDPLGH
jgi:hypothetical protein